MKELNYVCKMFGLSGGLHAADEHEHKRSWEENVVAKEATFKYGETFTLLFTYLHAVDDHNNLRHQVSSI